MTEDIEGLVTSISMNQVLVAILEEHGKLVVPTLRFLDANVSNKELQNVGSDIPGFSDPQKRIIHGLYPSRSLGLIHVVSAYVPNGQSLDSEKFKYKVSWLEAFNTWVKSSYGKSDHHILTGDFNIAPSDIDCHDPEAWKGNILVSQIERDLFDAIIDIGFDDSLEF